MNNDNQEGVNMPNESMTPIDVSKITITADQLKRALSEHLAKLKAGITRNEVPNVI